MLLSFNGTNRFRMRDRHTMQLNSALAGHDFSGTDPFDLRFTQRLTAVDRIDDHRRRIDSDAGFGDAGTESFAAFSNLVVHQPERADFTKPDYAWVIELADAAGFGKKSLQFLCFLLSGIGIGCNQCRSRN
ncbi:MAG: hypothetical protein MK102_17620 [Fuerstiella sp.]|nr:hypothetical protein [Fuerstiella sp.]